MNQCRFRDLAGHQCQRRDGRPIPAGDAAPCHYEARAQVADEIALAVQVDAVLPVSFLLSNRDQWDSAA